MSEHPPIPVSDDISAPFWEAARRGELVVHRCTGCGSLSYPPRLVCPKCLLDPPAFEWVPVSGRGELVTWTIVRDAFLPGFAPLVPYAVGDIRLAEQDDLRFVARLVDVDVDDLRIGLPDAVRFVDGGEDTCVPVFAPSEPSGSSA